MDEQESKCSPPLNTRSIVLLAIAFAAFALMHVLNLNSILDDAFISFRYAENLVNGHGLVFNPGERVEGYTNFLWVIFSTIPIALGLDPFSFARNLGLLSFVLIVFTLVKCVLDVGRNTQERSWCFLFLFWSY